MRVAGIRSLIACLFFVTMWQCAQAEEPTGQVLFVADDVYAGEPNGTPAVDSSAAQELFAKAQSAGKRGKISAALRWASRTLSQDPNHAAARRVLGYRRIGKDWAGGYAGRRLERGEIWHTEFGWIRAAELDRWNAGQRPLGKQWISGEDDAKRHAKIDRGWQIRTDHFRVRTNHSRKSAVELALRLETLYHVWQQLFGEFYLTKSELLKRIEEKESSGYRGKPFQVVYYRSRDQYNAALQRQQPRVGMTLGIYFDTTRSTHFFGGPEQDPGTIFHEGVHQLFHESARSAKQVGALTGAWAMEGVACYFESLTQESATSAGRFYRIGSREGGRLPAARHRRLVDDYYVPLQELTMLGMSELQRREDVARLYSQSAGLATFFMQYREGVYRQAFVEYLKLIYTGRDTATSLVELTGQSYQQLDGKYLDYLQGL